MSTWQHALRYHRRRYERWLDAAGLSLLVTTALVAVYAAYRWFGQDFRGYYGAARLVLHGGNPYDYGQLAPVLSELDGRAGNNPFYYAPWWALLFTPLAALIPYQAARAVWLALNLLLGYGTLALSQQVLGWRLRGGGRWLVYWSALALVGWMCLRYEQSSIFLAALLAILLCALRSRREWLAGLTLAFLLTKPNVTFLPAAVIMAIFWYRGHRRALMWAGLSLAAFLLISTLAIPGWYEPILRGNLPNGLTQVLDGPQQVVGIRINTTLIDWLKGFGLPTSWIWGVWSAVVLASLGLLAWAWRQKVETTYLVALAVTLGLVITPYALQYDYALLTLSLVWVYWKLPQVSTWQKGIGLAILAFLFSVLFWEGPISDGYWLVLGMGSLSVLLGWPGSKGLISKQSEMQAASRVTGVDGQWGQEP
jgi:hypothetical protein